MTRSSRLLTAASATVFAAVAFAPAAGAAPVTVTSGTADWSQTNVYVGGGTNPRTWLGFVTQPGSGRGQSAGTATASNGATVVFPDGSTQSVVTPTSPRYSAVTTDAAYPDTYAFKYGSAAGTVDADAKTADITTTGTVSYVQFAGQTNPPEQPPIKISNLHVVLTPTGGQVFAAIENSTKVYDPATPLYTLNTSAATFTTGSDGAVTVSGLVPTLAQADVFAANGTYPAGTSGPDRTPNTWGSFSLKLTLKAADPVPTTPEATTPVVSTPAPLTVPAPAPVATTPITVPVPSLFALNLKKTAFKATKSKVTVKIRKRGDFTIIGDGSVKGSKLTITAPTATKFSGDYVLRRVGGSSKLPKSVVVTIKAAK
jgi:hypothetical protein